MEVHAVLDALVEDVLRVVGSVNILELQGLHPLVLVIESSINDPISDGFSDDLLSLLDALEGQLVHDVRDRNARVRDVYLLQAKLNDGVLKAMDQRQVFVSLEELCILGAERLESLHVS